MWVTLLIIIILAMTGWGLWTVCKKQQNNLRPTNTDSFIGQTFLLQRSCDGYNTGTIRIGDVDWRVKSVNNQEIKEGSFVKVVKLEGNVLFVIETTYGV